MHYIPDTEDQDSAEETFWPEGYKQVIREEVPGVVAAQLTDGRRYLRLYRQLYSDRYAGYEQFIERLSEMVAIGAENGADDAFDEILDAFVDEDALPEPRVYSSYLWPTALRADTKSRVRQIIINEYSEDDVYRFAYNVGYKSDFATRRQYLERIGDIVVAGARVGASDALFNIYRAFIDRDRLLPIRRYPRRLRMMLSERIS